MTGLGKRGRKKREQRKRKNKGKTRLEAWLLGDGLLDLVPD
jgi:hypothetical protein